MKDEQVTAAELFRAHRLVFLRVLTRRLGDADAAEETFQEALIHYERAAKSEKIDNPAAFLMRVALNLAIDRVRQDTSRKAREKAWFESGAPVKFGIEYASDATGADELLMSAQKAESLRLRISELSPQVRRAFWLHKIDGLSHSETAARMGISKSTVEKHIMKAMRLLLDHMSGE
ncbi:MAG: sigma-70 family RNA polymerase sigma factor [Parvularculaceae bacterium]